MSGRFCTQGIANLPSLEGSRPCPGTSRGNADRNWCRRAGPVGPLGYHTARNLHHLQLWAENKKQRNSRQENRDTIFVLDSTVDIQSDFVHLNYLAIAVCTQYNSTYICEWPVQCVLGRVARDS